MTEVVLILISLLLVAACGAFVAAEFALITVNRSGVEKDAAAGDRRAAGVLRALQTLSTQLSGAQLGITITNLTIGFLAQPAIAGLLEGPLTDLGLGGAATSVSVVIALVLATALTMIFGELVPKNLAIAKPRETANAVTPFMRGFSKATAHLIRWFNGTANAILRMFGIEPQEELASARSPEELAGLVRHSAVKGTLAAETASWVQRSLAFGDRRAHDVMTPRSRMLTVAPEDSVLDLIVVAKSSGHSRFPVRSGDGEGQIIGNAHVRGALAVPFEERHRTPISSIMVEPNLLPDTLELDELLDILKDGGHQMAVLIDEFGDTAGLVTFEDLVEEIVGDVRDEHDREPQQVFPAGDGGWILSGLLRPDEVAAVIGEQVPDSGDYDTLGGLIVEHLSRLATVGDTVTVESPPPPGKEPALLEFTVLALDGYRIDQVRVTVTYPANPTYWHEPEESAGPEGPAETENVDESPEADK
ncbi:HlyC/CorC family transporter [Nakamurella silvestris]|nr:HlyC/CorC family transporter [Nakamurella silvestris]